MANVHLLLPSFNAGELSPLLGARFAVEKVQSGCRRLRNFIPHVHGPAFRRPGMEFLGLSAGAGSKSRLQGFNFSTSTGFVLEFHPNGLQVWSNGQLVPLRTPVPLPYSEQECQELQTASVNDVCYIAHPNHEPRRLVRYADNDWRLESLSYVWPPLGDENVRATEIATPTVTLRGEVYTYRWREFRMSGSYTFAVINPDTTSATKTARLQQLVSGTWTTRKTLSWRETPPGTVGGGAAIGTTWRIIFDGVAAAGQEANVTWDGIGLDLNGFIALDCSVAQPVIDQPITVPAGDWQTTVHCPATIPTGAKLQLQKRVGSRWVDYKTLKLLPNQITITRQATLTASTQFRFAWTGRAMNDGTAKIESIAFPVSDDITVQVDAVNGTSRAMTASEAIFLPGHVGSYWQIVHRRDTSFTQIVADQPTITAETSPSIRVSGKWEVYSYGDWAATLYLEKKVGGTWEVLRSWSSRKDRNVISSGEEDNETELRLRISAGTSEAASTAAVPRFVLEASDARVYGLVQIVGVGSLNAAGKSAEATVDVLTTLHSTAATSLWTEGAWSSVKGFPRTVTLHGQRLWFGGTRTEPLRLWGSVINDYQNFRRSSLDDASVSFTPAAQQSNALQWMVSHGQNLILGTSGDEWTLSGGTDQGPITPTSVLMQRRSGYGSQYQAGILLGEVVVFVQRGARKLRQVAPRQDGLVWSAADLTVLAEHVTKTGVTQIAAMTHPFSILWAVTTDGRLLGMTFEQEQNVFGWHVHTTDGFVESVAVVNGIESDEVWLQVKRGDARFIERLDPVVFARSFEDPARLIYLDAATRFEFSTPTAALTGLAHLEGREIQALGDGAELGTVRVVDGAATLPVQVSTAVVGLPFLSELQVMRQELPLRDGTAQGREWKVSRVALFLHESLGGEIADSPTGRPERLQFRTAATPMDTAPALFNGEIETAIDSRAQNSADVIVRQRSPLPMNIGSIVLKLDIFGE